MNFLTFAKEYGRFLLKDKRGFWGGVASAVGSIAGGALNYASQTGTNQKTIDLWREQAAYNTPANQMARYQAAGLNPNLVVTQGNPGNMASSPSLTSPKFEANPFESFVLDAQRKNMVEQNKNLQAQNALVSSQTSVANQEARRKALENDWLEKTGSSPLESPEFRSMRGLLSNNSLLEHFAEFLGSMRGKVDVMLSPRVRNKLDTSSRYENSFKVLRSR